MTTKIEITIPKSKKRPTSQQHRGTLHQRQDPEYLPRRLQRDVLVNFYDLGQCDAGSGFQDNTTEIVPGISQSFGTIFVDNLTLTDWDTLRTDIYSKISTHGLDAFKKLSYTDAEKYGLDLYLGASNAAFDASKYFPIARDGSRLWIKDISTAISGNTKWTADGLKVKKGTSNFLIFSNSAFVSGRTVNTQYKFTAGDSYSDPSVSFTFDRDCDVFLMPQIIMEAGVDRTTGSGTSKRFLNLLFVTMNRSLFLPLDYSITANNINFNTGTAFEYQGTVNAPAGMDLDAHLALMKSRSNARLWLYSTGTLGSVSAFPVTSGGVKLWDARYTSAISTSDGAITGGQAKIKAGTLVAIVRKSNGDLVYVWHDGDDLFNAGNRFNSGTGGY